MYIYFFDTDVWLKLITEREFHFLNIIKEKLDNRDISFIIPGQLNIELTRNFPRIIGARKQTIKTYLKHSSLLLNELPRKNDYKLSTLKDDVKKYLASIDDESDNITKVFWEIINHKNNIKIKTSDQILIKVANKALQKKAPFCKNKNSIGDAILFECFKICINSQIRNKVTFLTLNYHDFSNPNDPKLMHDDLLADISHSNFIYSIELGTVVEEILNTKLDTKEKKRLNNIERFELIHEPISECEICGNRLEFIGHKVLYGYFGILKYCSDCEKYYMELDDNY